MKKREREKEREKERQRARRRASERISLCAASRMWVRHRSVVIVPPEGGLEFSAGLTKKIVFYSCHD